MTEKKIVRSYQGFNSKLYNPKADIGEKNSGEVKVDTTGYVPLQDLLRRCGIGQHLNVNINFEERPGLDKFNDNVDFAQSTIDRFNQLEEQAIQNVIKRKNSVKSQPQAQDVEDSKGTSKDN